MANDGVMETHVDKLMQLMQSKKYISMAAAAKELQVPKDTVEEWTGFLEEEGLLKVKYQLTTPYIQWIEKKEVDGKLVDHEPSPDETEHATNEASKVENLVAQTRSKIKDKDFEAARETYKKARDALSALPVKFLAEKHRLEDEVIQLHKEISDKMDAGHGEILQKRVKELQKFVQEGKKSLQAKDINTAIKTYNVIKTKFLQLPHGYFKEKRTITENILSFYQQLSTAQHDILSKDLQHKSNSISSGLQQVNNHLLQNQVNSAHEEYSKVKETFDSLPTGFLEEKVSLQNQMLDTYKALLLNQKDQTSTDVYKLNLEINEMLEEMKASLRQSKVQRAVELYSMVKQTYANIPKGFLRNEALIQKNILGAYKLLIDAQQSKAIHSMKTGSSELDFHFQNIEKYIAHNNLDVAMQHYSQAVAVYNGLPSGVTTDKIALRKRLYDQYYTLISKTDLIQLGHLEPYVKQKYFKVLDLLLTAHKAIDSQEFDLLRQVYPHIHTAYHELPLYVVRKKPKIVEEVHTLYKLISLYEKTLELERLMQQGRVQELHVALEDMKKNMEAVEAEQEYKNPLLQYLGSQYSQYAKFLHQPALTQKQMPSNDSQPRSVVDSLIMAKKQKALEEIGNNNSAGAIPHLRSLLELDPQNMEARYMLNTITRKK